MSGYNFAYLDEQTKRMIRRAILKAVAIPGHQVPFGGREMPLPYGWGTGGIQVTAAILGPEDVLKVIDQGADDTTNAVSIRRFFARTAGVATTTRTTEATIIQTRHRIPETKLRADQILVYQVPMPEPLAKLEPSRAETRQMHALAEYGLMHVKLYEDIARFGHVAISYDYPVMVNGRYLMSPFADSRLRHAEDEPDAGAPAVRRRAREAHLRDPALYGSPPARFRRPSVPARPRATRLRALRGARQLPRRGRDRRPRRPHVRLLRHRLLRRASGHGRARRRSGMTMPLLEAHDLRLSFGVDPRAGRRERHALARRGARHRRRKAAPGRPLC